MKTLRKNYFVLFICGVLMSCEKKETTPAAKPNENPMTVILEDKSWVQTLSPAPVSWELGYIFSASTSGKITQLGCRLPEPGIYTVSLWEQSTKKLIRQKGVEQTSPDKFTLATVDELAIEKDVKYIISVNSTVGGKAKSYFRISNNNANIFPIVRGNILIQSSTYSASTTPVFPNAATETGRMYGYSEFTFVPNY